MPEILISVNCDSMPNLLLIWLGGRLKFEVIAFFTTAFILCNLHILFLLFPCHTSVNCTRMHNIS